MEIEKNPRTQGELSLVISGSGFGRLDREWACKDMCSPYSRVYYITDGEGRVTVGDETVPLLAGHVYLIPAGLRFDYACDKRMDQLFFHINLVPANGRELFSACRRVLFAPVEREALSELLTLYRADTFLHTFRLETRLRQDIARFLEASAIDTGKLGASTPFLASVFRHVRQGLSAGLTVRFLAGAMGISESTLAKRFRQEAGVPLGRYIDSLLMQEARKRLVSSDTPIREIAEALDFCDQFYFSRYFKQREGETPSQYRRKHLARI